MTARLNAYLNANTSEFEAGLKNAARQVGNFTGKAQGAFSKFGGVVAGVATGAFVAFVANQAKVIDETRKAAGSLNIQLEAFQALARVADEAGVEQEALTKAMTKTQQVIVEAANGNKTYQESLNTLGLSTKELLTLSPDQQFIKFADALAKIENPTQRVSLAMDIFGKQGRAIINLLPQLSEKIEEARQFNEKFNISLSDIDAMKVEEANDTFGRLIAAVGGFGNTVAVEVAPAITALSNAILQAGVDGEEFTKVTRAGIFGVLAVVDGLRLSFQGLKIAFLAVATGIQEAIYKFILEPLSQIDESISNIARRFGKDFGETPIQKFTKDWKTGVDQGKKATADAITELDKFNFSWNVFNEEQTKATERARESNKEFNKMNDTFNGISESLEDAGKNKLQDVIDDLKFSTEQLSRNNEQQEIYNNLRRAGVDADTAAGDQVRELTSTFVGLQKQTQRNEAAADGLLDAFGSFFESAIDGSKSFSESLTDLAKSVADLIWQIQVLDPLKDALTGGTGVSWIDSLFGGGGASSSVQSDFIDLSFDSSMLDLFSDGMPSFATGSRYIPRDMNARLHRGEMIIPRSEVGKGVSSGDVIINNNNGSRVSGRRDQSTGNLRIEIDEAIAYNVRQRGTKTNQAITAQQNRSLTQR